ncbi:MAG: ABC transporter [Cycloclasticus sp.]|nr:ABC transporter [Cycloclasticus sp.]MBG96671.1 ABC transporter [Cycloclasticus sp.]HAI96008.1 ABC transporter [Methylococcaceae bacterium]|tara:strand:+ start:2946 stop:4295 length:1350 start_codon:yes stop_codon:yes gene_type:complete
MKISRKKHRYIRLQNILFTVLFVGCLGLLAWLSTQYTHQSDWTANNRNSLSAQSIQLLGKLKQPIEITAYASENDILRQQITELAAKYIQHKTDISLEIINPDTRPDRAREEGITTDGELILRYNGKRESLQQLNEQALTNALQRLTNSEQQWVVFLSGHGERNPSGHANFDYGIFANELKKKGINSQTINLVDSPSIPINTSLLIIADPKTTLLKGEVSLIKDYLAKGRPLLLLGEPNHSNIIKPLTEWLGIELLPGTVVDATTQLFGIDDPTFALVTEYPHHLATQHLQAMSLFPGAAGLTINPDGPYTAHPLLSTLERSWTETSSIEGHIQFDPHTDEKQGPISIGYALSKNDSSGKEQRLAVLGDADFISNSFLGNGANLDLGLSLIQWLNHNDTLIEIPAKTALDTTLDINETWSLIFGLGFLFVLPAVFILCGLVIWLKRKKR